MLSAFDDYPIHQTPEPLAHLASGDRNFYDRYFFNGYTPDASLFFAAALGVYPNRRVMDAAVSVVQDGRQHVLRASRLALADRTTTRVGPIAVAVEEPMRSFRVKVGPNEFEIEGELRFRSRTAPIEEPRFVHRQGAQVTMDATRLTQFGDWEGWLRLGGAGAPRRAIDPGETIGCRDRSWGIRPVGEREAGAPGAAPQFFWLWAPLRFEDSCTHFDVNEDGAGRAWHANGNRLRFLAPGEDPLEAGDVETLARVAHDVRWRPGTRRAESAVLTLTPFAGEPLRIELEPILCFQMLGLGYLHPNWGHGMWKGELVVDGEAWKLDELEPLDLRHIHVQQLCRARRDDGRLGLGVFEQLVIGPHAPSGFEGLLDGAR